MLRSKAFEHGSDVGGEGCGIGIADNDMVKVSGDAFEAFDDLVDFLDEPVGGGTAALRHDEPLEKPARCAEGGEGNCILVDDNLVEGGAEVEQGEDPSFAQGVEDLVDAEDGGLSEGANGAQLLTIDGDAGASIFLGDDDHWAGV